jgi:rhodanese-related sulfurtransferase
MFNFLSSLTKSNYENLGGSDFKSRFQTEKGSVLLDVRTPAEYSGGSIPGSKNLDFNSSQFRSGLEKLDKSKTYFVFCRSGGRSAGACTLMAEKGFKVCNLAGGIGAWPR